MRTVCHKHDQVLAKLYVTTTKMVARRLCRSLPPAIIQDAGCRMQDATGIRLLAIDYLLLIIGY